MSKQASQFERDGGVEILRSQLNAIRESAWLALAALEPLTGPAEDEYGQRVQDAQAQVQDAETQPAAEYPDAVLERANRLARSAEDQSEFLNNPLFGTQSPDQPQSDNYGMAA